MVVVKIGRLEQKRGIMANKYKRKGEKERWTISQRGSEECKEN